MRLLLIALLIGAPFAALAEEPSPYVWPPEQRGIVEDWFKEVGERKPNETLGELAVRAGKLRLGTPYLDAPQIDAPEELNIKLDTLQCQSFVESSLSIARCITEGTPNAECFAREVQQFRYRDGLVNGFDSRLHYFNDWLADNAKRNAIVMLEEKDTTKWGQQLNYMTKHAKRYPALAHPEVLAAITADEARISAADNRYVPKQDVAAIEKELKTGDVLAFVSSQKPGLMISHTGFVVREPGGVMKILHASSYHGKVIITRTDLAGYVNSRPDRLGVIVARPQAPVTSTATAAAAPH